MTGSAPEPERMAQGAVRVGLIGKGIQNSRTPAMHRAEGAALGVHLSYELIDPDAMAGPEPALADMLADAEARGFAGVNVTHPYKKTALAHLNDLSETARRVGAVNTVLFRNGTRTGHNTDFWGFAESARQGLRGVPRDTVLLLGAGGAGGAVAHALTSLGVGRLMIADLDPGAAAALARDTRAEAVTDIAEAATNADGLVNATPMGMAAHPGMAINPDLIRPRHWVADVVYFPRETTLLRAARNKRCRVLDGSGMAIFQAVRAFELFTGRTPDAGRMRASLESFDTPRRGA